MFRSTDTMYLPIKANDHPSSPSWWPARGWPSSTSPYPDVGEHIPPPIALTVALEADTGSSATDNITNNGKVIISGVVPNATWLYSTDSGTTWEYGTSSYSFMLTDNTTYVANAIQVKQVDSAGSASAITKMGAITVDKTAPVFSSTETGQGALNQDVVVYDAEVTGGDTGTTYTISGTDAAKFSIGATDGKIKYKSAPTAETTTPDSITITATDVAGNATTKDVEISVAGKLVSASGSSTIDGAKNIDVRSPIVLTFSEEVTANANFKITLTDTNKDGIGWKNDKTQNNQVIDANDATQVAITKNANGQSVVTINPTYDLDFSTHYTVSIDAGAFTSVSNTQASLAINMSFDTVTPAKSTFVDGERDGLGKIGIKSHIQVAGVDALVDSNWWIDAHQSNPTAAAILVQAGLRNGVDKDIAVAVSLRLDGNVTEAGYIRLWGKTDMNDITYGDIANSANILHGVIDAERDLDIGDRTKQFIQIENWTNDITADDAASRGFNGKRGATKNFGSSIGGVFETSIVFSDAEKNATTTIVDDAGFNAIDPSHGAVLYG